MPKHAAAAVAIRHFSLYFQKKALFQNFSLTLPRQSWMTLLGASGVGKSTLLRAIAGLEKAYSGSIQRDVPRLAYMPQQDALLPWLSVLDNVQLKQHLAGEKNAASRQKAEELLLAVGLQDCQRKPLQALSGGQRQRVALARTLMADADLILMDEPFSAVDAITRRQLQELAWQLLADKTVLLITHDPLEALRLSDVVHVLQGRPVQLSEALQLPRTASWAERSGHYETLWQRLAVSP